MHKGYPRMFIGLDLAPKDKLALQEWRDKHLHGLSDKPVPVENFHITLSFLGQVSPDKFELLDQKLTEMKARQFQLKTTELGHFPKAKILYLGTELTDPLADLARQARSINNALGLPLHHGTYRPHITLTRKHTDLVPIVSKVPELTLSFDQFHLFESVSAKEKGKPPHYPKRASFDLLPNLGSA